ncbi:MAG: RNA polymerase sigma-70 factor [Cyclobacteriaceae bacterium]|nr:RNA polymerase sigma-70 factor [Cyclobacteriaceae bacterium HetDA_MAG_MS6]
MSVKISQSLWLFDVLISTRMRQELSDQELLQLLEKGNELALDQLFSRYWEPMFQLALNITDDPDLSSDIVQDIFVDLWERRATRKISHLQAYLNRAIKNQMASYIRKTKHIEQFQQHFESMFSVDDTEQPLLMEELQDTIDEQLQKLPNRCREIFKLSRYHSLSNQEIADRLNISLGTVEVQISRALRHLRYSLSLNCTFLLGCLCLVL